VTDGRLEQQTSSGSGAVSEEPLEMTASDEGEKPEVAAARRVTDEVRALARLGRNIDGAFDRFKP
jgi:hypothetical protein